MLWAILCIDNPNSAETRDRLRTIHREHLDKHGKGLFFSGPLLADDDENDQIGSLFVLNAASRQDAHSFIDPEPFNRAGVFAEIRIFRMRKGRFDPLLVDGV